MAFTPEEQALRDLAEKAVMEAGNEAPPLGKSLRLTKDNVRDQCPLAVDLVNFVLWLRKNTDYFSGPELDLHYPEAEDPDFWQVLGENALVYTGE